MNNCDGWGRLPHDTNDELTTVYRADPYASMGSVPLRTPVRLCTACLARYPGESGHLPTQPRVQSEEGRG